MALTSDRVTIEAAAANARAALLAARTGGGHWEGHLSSSALSTATAIVALQVACDDPAGAAMLGAARVARARARVARGREWLGRNQNADGGWGDTTISVSNISTTALCWAALEITGERKWENEKGKRGGVAEESDGGGTEATSEGLRVRGSGFSGGRAGESSDAAAARPVDAADPTARAAGWLTAAAGSLDAGPLAEVIARRYGDDRTFSVPILTVLALAGKLGADGWRRVPQLPFELAACPQSWFRFLRLPVVSYALPALIAMGQARHANRPTRNPIAWLVRRLTARRTLRVLREIQPSSGGYLEATPLTSFVVMSLVAARRADHAVVEAGVDFLLRSARGDEARNPKHEIRNAGADGGAVTTAWPIDTNLATWVTTLSVNALAAGGDLAEALPGEAREALVDWLVGQQYRCRHPYTGADPGGWAWTDLPGGVPDADDTAGALIALRNLAPGAGADGRVVDSAAAGVRWLLDLQNGDGGIPTFCRGWGRLPFDRSAADLTAHALQAWRAWQVALPEALAREVESAAARAVESAAARALGYLLGAQAGDGSWVPLWFGNQHAADDANPTYGTARVLPALCAERAGAMSYRSGGPSPAGPVARATGWLLAAQNADGSWGGAPGAPGSIEETALAVHALACARGSVGAEASGSGAEALDRALAGGGAWLIERTRGGHEFEPAPIGFYFAKLWYHEALYAPVFTAAALGALARGR